MIKVYSFEGKNEDECRINCLDSLDVYNNEIISRAYEMDNKYVMEVVKKEDIKNFIIEYINSLGSKMGLELHLNIYEEDNIFLVRINSKENAILIGKDGKTLNSIQYLIRKTISNTIGFNISVNLDVSNYKKKIEKKFESDIKKIINEVLQTKIETKLDPMNSYKRRIVHSIASNYYNIETVSMGEEPNRYTIIKYIDK